VRRAVVATLALASLALASRPAFAHGFGQSYDLPLPLWLYLYGAAAAVLVSFVPISLFAGWSRSVDDDAYPRLDLLRIGLLRVVLTSQGFLLGLRLLSVALFLLVILSGLLGEQAESYNFAPTFVWIVWWVGLSFFTAFVGNLWPLVNPWKILFGWADALSRRLLGVGLELREPYPEGWGVWPAVAHYAAFIWVELVFYGSSVPLSIALLTLSYSVVTWIGMAVFGEEVWLRRGEAFSVFFGILGRFAPTEVRVNAREACRECAACGGGKEGCVNCYECFARARPEDRELDLRPPAVGLAHTEPPPRGGMIFVVLMLAGVAYDGLLATPLWLEIVRLTSLTQTLGLFTMSLAFLAVYLLFVKLSQLSGGGGVRLGLLAVGYVYSLVPIAIAYQVAHYYTYLLIQGQGIIGHLSDPFGWGWNVFGTAGYEIEPGIVDAAFVWYSQVALIVAGHVVAVYLAHLISLRFFGSPGKAIRSQFPMLALMILYTISSLWILSQPIVEDDRAGIEAEAGASTLREHPEGLEVFLQVDPDSYVQKVAGKEGVLAGDLLVPLVLVEA
jgi:hypothetical protein